MKISQDGQTVTLCLNKWQRAALEESADLCGEDFRRTMLDYLGKSASAFMSFAMTGEDAVYLYDTGTFYRFSHKTETSALVQLIWTGKAKFTKI